MHEKGDHTSDRVQRKFATEPRLIREVPVRDCSHTGVKLSTPEPLHEQHVQLTRDLIDRNHRWPCIAEQDDHIGTCE